MSYLRILGIPVYWYTSKPGKKMINRDTAGLETSCEKCNPGFYNDIPGNETCK
jgi:hypothetical protein